MTFFPINIDISNKQILIIGGGKIALQKAATIKKFTSNITVIAPEICDELMEITNSCFKKKYTTEDLKNTFLVYACTNDRTLNKIIKKEAEEKKILVNVADDRELCAFISPAIYKNNNMTVAVCSNGEDVKKSLTWRKKIKELLEHDLS